MTFKDLKKRVSSSLETTHSHRLFDKLCNKPFWIWNIEQHEHEDIQTNGDCCFNHIIGLPTKERVERPIFDYQRIMCDALQILYFCNPSRHDFKHKHLWVKKATGLGVTELFLRLMAWVCLKDDTYTKNSQMCIIKELIVHSRITLN